MPLNKRQIAEITDHDRKAEINLCVHYTDTAFDVDSELPAFRLRLAGHMVFADDTVIHDIPDHRILVIDMDMSRAALNKIAQVIVEIQEEYDKWKEGS